MRAHFQARYGYIGNRGCRRAGMPEASLAMEDAIMLRV